MSLLPSSFYTRTDVVQIAKDLLGKYLVSTTDGLTTAGMIVETEAYRAPDDKGCHAYQNKLTDRTSTMFAIGGTSYVYICYGIHNLFNVVTGPKGVAHAVLVRAVEPVEGLEYMMERRKLTVVKKEMVNGPGKFTRAMNITKSQNNISLLSKANSLWLESRGTIITKSDIVVSPRVGMGVSVAECSNWPWRFRIRDNKWTSKPDHVYYRPHA